MANNTRIGQTRHDLVADRDALCQAFQACRSQSLVCARCSRRRIIAFSPHLASQPPAQLARISRIVYDDFITAEHFAADTWRMDEKGANGNLCVYVQPIHACKNADDI